MADASIIVKIVDQTRGGLGSVTSQIDSLNRKTTTLGGNMDGLTRRIAAVGTAIATSFVLNEVVTATARFEDLRDSLNTVTGSIQNGERAFNFIQDFATKTQFGVEALTETYIKLAASGITPTAELLTTFTDTAAVTTDQMGSLQAITDLFARTTSGGLGLEELNRLADRGVPVFKILEEQLGLTRLEISEFGKTAEGANIITQALIQGLNQEFGGATQDRLDNLSTAMSNFGIAVTQAMVTFGEGFRPALVEATTNMTDFILKNEELIEGFGRLVGQGLNFVIENFDLLVTAGGAFFTMFAVNKIVGITSEFANLALSAGRFLAAMAPTIIAGVSSAIATLRTGIIALNLTMLTNPIALAIAAISAAVLLAITHWDDFSSAVSNAFNSAENIILQVYKTFLEFIETAINGAAQAVYNMGVRFTSVLKGIWEALKNPTNAMTAFKDEIEKGRQKIEDTDVTVVDFSGKIQDLERRLDENRQTTEDATDATQDLGDAKDDTADATDGLTDATDDETVAVDDNTYAVQDNESAQVDLQSQLERVQNRVERVEGAWQDYTDTLEENVRMAGLSAEAREVEREKLRALEAMARELGKTVEDLTETERANAENFAVSMTEKIRAAEEYADAAREFDRETNRLIQENYRATTTEVQRLEDSLQEYQANARRLGLENHKETQDAILEYERQIGEARIEEAEDVLQAQRDALNEFKSEYNHVYSDIEDFLDEHLGITESKWNRFNQWWKFLTGTELLGSFDQFLGGMLMGTQQTTTGIVNTMEGGLIPAVPNIFSNIGTFIGNIFGVNGGGGILGTIGNFVTQALGLFGAGGGGLWGGIKNIFSGIGDWFGNLFGGGGGFMSSITDGISNILGDVVGAVTGVFGGGGGGSLPPGMNINDLLNPPAPTAESMIASGMPYNVAHGVPEIVGVQQQMLPVMDQLASAMQETNASLENYIQSIDDYQYAQAVAMQDGILTDQERAILAELADYGNAAYNQATAAEDREIELARLYDQMFDKFEYLARGSAGMALDVNLNIQAMDSQSLIDNLGTVRDELTAIIRDSVARSGRSL